MAIFMTPALKKGRCRAQGEAPADAKGDGCVVSSWSKLLLGNFVTKW
jgi:hypothetical protein